MKRKTLKRNLIGLVTILVICISLFTTNVIKIKAEGIASQNMTNGQVLEMGTYNGQPLYWIVVGSDGSGNKLLALRDCLPASSTAIASKTFNPATTKAEDGHDYRNLYGSNRWSTSTLRRWLNSDKPQGETDYRTSYYTGNPYGGEKGFLTNFSEKQINSILEVTQKTVVGTREIEMQSYEGGSAAHTYNTTVSTSVQNYDNAYYENTTDKMFLLSIPQVKAISDLGLENFAITLTNYWWPRDAYSGNSNSVRLLYPTGIVDGTSAYFSSGVRPAFYMRQGVLLTGSGTVQEPYQVKEEDAAGSSAAGFLSTLATVTTGEVCDTPENKTAQTTNVACNPGEIMLTGVITNLGGATISKRGFLICTSSNFATSTDINETSTNDGYYELKATGLTPGTTYYYKSYVESNIGFGATRKYGQVLKVVVGVPKVNLTRFNDRDNGEIISSTQVNLYGRFVASRGQKITGLGFYWWKSGESQPSAYNSSSPDSHYALITNEDDLKTILASSDGKFKVTATNASGFTSGATYYFKAVVLYNGGQFTTSAQNTIAPGQPAFNDVGNTSSTTSLTSQPLSMNVSLPNGALKIKGVKVGTVAGVATGTEFNYSGTDLSAGGTYTVTATGLVPGTKYYYYGYAENDVSATRTIFDAGRSFILGQSNLSAASNIKFSSADFTITSVTNDTTYTITERGVQYSTDGTNWTTYPLPQDKNTVSSYTFTLSGLNPSTSYQVRTYTKYNGITDPVYGDEFKKTFTTGKVIYKTSLQGLAAPQKGSTAVTSFSTNEYSASVVWNGDNETSLDEGKFKGDTEYTAVVTLSYKAGWLTNDITEDMYQADNSLTCTNDAKSPVITITYAKTDENLVTDFNIDGVIAPVKNQTVTDCTSSINSENSNEWICTSFKYMKQDGTPVSSGSSFIENEIYKVEIKITPNSEKNYRFTGILENAFEVTGAEETTSTQGSYETDEITIVATFDVCGEGKPTKPNNLNGVYDKTGEKITLSWTAPTNDYGSQVTNYKVYRSENLTTPIATLNSTTLSYDVSGITTLGNYSYSVTAVSAKGEGAKAQVTVKVCDVPNAPSNFKAERTSDSLIKLTWEKPNDNNSEITGYKLSYAYSVDYMSQDEKAGMASTPWNAISSQTESRISGMPYNNYTFEIVAINEKGESAVSTYTLNEFLGDNLLLDGLEENYSYTGSAINPSYSVRLSGIKPLIKDTDYTATISNNTDVGEATITITGKSETNLENMNKTFHFNIVLDKVLNISKPVKGETATTTISSNGVYSASVVWNDDNATSLDGGKFKGDTVYAAVVTLNYIPSDFQNSWITENMFAVNPDEATSVTNSAGSRVVTITYPKTAFNDVTDLTINGVTIPSKGVALPVNPTSSITSTNNEWTCTSFKYYKEDDDAKTAIVGGTFEADTVYKAEITLTRNANNYVRFSNLAENAFTVTGATSALNAQGSYDDETVTVTATFGKTADGTQPTAPQNFKAEYDSTSKEMTLTWDAPSDDGGHPICSYIIYDNEDNLVTRIDSPFTHTHTITNVETLGEYIYKIYALNENHAVSGNGETAVSEKVTLSAKPDTPGTFKALRDDSDMSITLSWTKPNDNYSPLTKYVLSYGSTNVDIDKDLTSFKLTSMPYDEYVFSIVAVNANGSSEAATDSLDEIDETYLTVTGIDENGYTWTGSAIEPVVTVKQNNYTLQKNTDYSLTYSNNTNVSTSSAKANVKITGLGRYNGIVIDKPFTISPIYTVIDEDTTTYAETKEAKVKLIDKENVDTENANKVELSVKIADVTSTIDASDKTKVDDLGKPSSTNLNQGIFDVSLKIKLNDGAEKDATLKGPITVKLTIPYDSTLSYTASSIKVIHLKDGVATSEPVYNVQTDTSSNIVTFDIKPVSLSPFAIYVSKKSSGGGGSGGGGGSSAPATPKVEFKLVDDEKLNKELLKQNETELKNYKFNGNKVTSLPEKLQRDGFNFDGWYKDKNFKEKVNIGDTLQGNVTLYAKWKEEKIYKDFKAYMKGYDDGEFKPNRALTRAEVATIIARLSDGFDEDKNYGKDSFPDTRKNFWYSNYIKFVEDNKIFEGYPDGEFKPERQITRGELVKVLVTFSKLELTDEEKKNIKTFNDVKENAFFKEYASILLTKGLIKGYDDGSFKGNCPVTRAEAITMINSILESIYGEIEVKETKLNFNDVKKTDWFFGDVLKATSK